MGRPVAQTHGATGRVVESAVLLAESCSDDVGLDGVVDGAVGAATGGHGPLEPDTL